MQVDRKEDEVDRDSSRASVDRTRLSVSIRRHAIEAGFDAVGITSLRPSDHAQFYERWIAAGHHGSMHYLARADAVASRADPSATWPGLSSAIVVTLNYAPPVDDAAPAQAGVIARYARGRDYHRVVKKKLLALLGRIEADIGRDLPVARAYVDTGPVFERELARRAGLGWFGRNTMLIHPKRGSYFFLGVLFVDIELEDDAPFEHDYCGSCNACVDACPTGALLGRDADGAPVIDATRCISYLTIESRGPIPRALRPLIGNRVFGCDICQEVCPFTRKFSEPGSERDFTARGPGEPPAGVTASAGSRTSSHPGTDAPPLIELMALDDAAWDEFSRGSALRRAGRAGFLRNVAVALGNWGSSEAVPVLAAALSDKEPIVRGHAAWALGRIGSPEARVALTQHQVMESDRFAAEELAEALRLISGRARPD